MGQLNRFVVLSACLFGRVFADWQFRSRPDLSPPRLNITTPASSDVEKGYIFVTPYPAEQGNGTGPLQPGAYIFRDNGDLVWSSLGYLAAFVANFRPGIWNGQQVLYAYQGQLVPGHGRAVGHHVVLNQKYETIKVTTPSEHKVPSVHEFQIINEKTALIEVPVPVPVQLKPWGGDKSQQWILSSGFQEVDIQTGELVFEWYSYDHIDRIDPADSYLKLDELPVFLGRQSEDSWDYFHLNSVDKNSDGDYLISARNTATIYKIDGKTGDVVWQLGGKHGSNFSIPAEVAFAFQHDARFLHRSEDGTIEIISFFDNAAHSQDLQVSNVSRARIVRLNHTDGTATELTTLPAPDGLSAHSQGNNQVLPNGNVFVNWGQAGAVTEFEPHSKRVLFHAYLDSSPEGRLVQSYRGFRANWTGTPLESPAIVALRSDDGAVSIHVSWNGDTETASWRFFLDSKSLGEVERRSFETVLKVEKLGKGHIHAEAIDAFGQVLTRTAAVTVLRDVTRDDAREEHNPFGALQHVMKRIDL